MFDALYIGATGMQAQQANVDTIANNLANVNTAGFKKGRVRFSDLMVQGSARAGLDQVAGNASAAPATIAGVGIAAASRSFDAGDIKKTDSPYDVAVLGDGFLELAMPDGSRAFMRGDTLKVNAEGQLANRDGVPLKPGVAIPEGAQALTILADGRVQVRVAGQAAPLDVGQLELVRFSNPQGLVAQGGNLYRASEASGEPSVARPGESGMGTIAQGYLEGSNVKMVEEMVNLMVAQRAYEASVKVVQASDEMLGMVNGLRK